MSPHYLAKTSKRLALLSLLLIPLIVGFVWHFKSHKNETPPIIPLMHKSNRLIVPPESPLRQLIKVDVAKKQPVAATYIMPAMVKANPAKMMNVLTPLAGRIVHLNKFLGDNVQAGDILFTVDAPEFTQAMTDLERAKSNVLVTTQNLTRQQKLSVSKIGAQRDTEQARNDFVQAQTEYERAKIRLEQLGAERSTTDKKPYLVIRSHIAGQVVDLHVAQGAFWNDPTSTIMTIADLSTVYITASAKEKDLVDLFVGQKATVILDAYPTPIYSSVKYIDAMLNPETRTANVYMLYDNVEGKLKPNMFAKAIFSGHLHDRIVLPLTAIIQKGFESTVFVEVAPWEFENRIVTVGPQHGKEIEVISGLKENEPVVVTGGIVLND